MTRMYLTKTEAIEHIDDLDHARAVALRMWEAFFAAHSQAAHAIEALRYGGCKECRRHLRDSDRQPCEQWRAWQAKVTAGFGSV